MADVQTPAGASQPAPAGAGQAPEGANEPIDRSIEGIAARRLERRRLAEQEAEQKLKREPAEAEEPQNAQEPGQEPEPAAGEAEDVPEGAPSEPGEADEPNIVPGNALTRMQDGSVRPIGELKKAWGELQELRKLVPDVEAVRSLDAARGQIQEQQTALQQRAQQLDELLPYVQHVLEARVPKPPDASLRETDPIEWMIQKDRYESEVAQFRQVQQLQQQRDQEARTEAEKRSQEYIAEQRTKLLGKHPELKDRAVAEAFYKDLVDAATDMGYSADDVDRVHDHRLISGIVKLWRVNKRLEAARSTAQQKATGVPPVQMPGRRMATGEINSGQVEKLRERARSSGSVDDVVALRIARKQAQRHGTGN